MFLQPWEQRQVPAQAAGLLADVLVDVGQQVEQGAVLVKMDDREQLIARDRAKVELGVVKQRLQHAQEKVALKAELFEIAANAFERAIESNRTATDSVPQAELEKLRGAKQQAKYDLSESKHELQILESTVSLKEQDLHSAECELAKRTIIAPILGEVVDVHIRSGEWIEPGEPLVRILRTDKLMVETLIPSNATIDQLENMSVNLIVDMPNHPSSEFTGTIDFVSPEVGAVDGQSRIRIRVDNSQMALRPGFQVRFLKPLPTQ
ncbi:MAG: HlyD family efflux transporter periplasmic adaptor subunit [Planctomycetales bacterium]|nr:HlyD family efflux transporter periplasmic adaptor subunit [Planctomycetales bacterium]